MKVAIVGAGLSGLTCALELEKKGIIPDVFEKDNNVGWAWSEVSYWPNMFYNGIGDPISAFRKVFDTYKNEGFDKTLSFLGKPGIKQLMYNSNIPFADIAGKPRRDNSMLIKA